MDISFEQREAIRCLYAYGCEGAIGPGGMIVSSGGGSALRLPTLGTPETWLRLVSLGLVTGNGPHRIRLTAQGEEEARRPAPSKGIRSDRSPLTRTARSASGPGGQNGTLGRQSDPGGH